jgi:hypothetical protein
MRLFLLFFVIFSFSFVSAFNDECSPEDVSCLQSYFSSLVNEEGISSVVSSVSSLFDDGVIDSDTCHFIGHALGRELVRVEGFESAVSKLDHFCRSGLIHGVFEGKIRSDGEGLDVVSLCSSNRFSSEHVRLQCLHGLGHGLMMYHAYDLSSALAKCSLLSSGDAFLCSTGVYMEGFFPSMVDERIGGDVGLLSSFCSSNRFSSSCFYYVGLAFLFDSGSLSEVGSWCSSLVDRSFRNDCFRGLGVLLSRNYGYDVKKVSENCIGRYEVRSAASKHI